MFLAHLFMWHWSFGSHHEKKSAFNIHKTRRLRSSCACSKYYLGLCSLFIHSVVSNDSISGQWRPWSDRGCSGQSGPSLSIYTRRHVFAWRYPFGPMLLMVNCFVCFFLVIGVTIQGLKRLYFSSLYISQPLKTFFLLSKTFLIKFHNNMYPTTLPFQYRKWVKISNILMSH